MNFAQLIFWELLAIASAVIGLSRLLTAWLDRRALALFDKLALLALGLFLLLCVSWLTFVIYLAVAIGTYLGLSWILHHHAAARRRYLGLLIPLQLTPLLYYKYAHFIAHQVLGFNHSFQALLIPVGISFYTFQKVAFVIDTLHFQKPLPSFIDYMNFAGFFPQIVAGPIERRENLLPQMAQFQFRWSAAAINEGVSWIALGFFFKSCLADNLAALFRDASTTNAYLIWLANVLFGLRIYYDFAGYSLIALGTARALGIRLTLNFASPYCATSSTEFWRRWHITLSQWFRDYLYVPLGGNRTRWWFFNIALVFVVSGIWHGAGWNFVCWGALHGAFLITNRLLGPRLHLPAPLGWLLTMFATFFAWLAFYESRTPDLTAKMAALFTPAAYSREAFRAALASYGPGDRYILGCFVGLTACVLVAEWLSVRWRQQPYSLLLRSPALACTVGMTLLLAPIANNGFIYFAF